MSVLDAHYLLFAQIIILKLCGCLDLGIGWIILIAFLFLIPAVPIRTAAFIVFKLLNLLTIPAPISWWWILIPIAIDICSLASFFGATWVLVTLVNAATYVILLGCGVISLSWWWIIPATILFTIPSAKTIIFLLFKIFGLFAMPVSWWCIFIPIFLDLCCITEQINRSYHSNKKETPYKGQSENPEGLDALQKDLQYKYGKLFDEK